MRQYCFLLIAMIATACQRQPDAVTAGQLSRYCADPKNGLVVTEREGPWTLEVRYRPSSLLVAQHLSGAGSSLVSSTDSLQQYLDSNSFFLFRINREGESIKNWISNTKQQDVDSLWRNLIFSNSHNFSLLTDGESFPCTYYQLENRGNVDPGMVINLGFDTPLNGNAELVWNDSVFTGKVHTFRFNYSDILNTPSLLTSTTPR